MSDYDKQLSDWKAKHGLAEMTETNRDEMRMAAEDNKSKGKSWCFGCDKHMPIKDMKLITRRIDAYVQYDEGQTDYIAKSCRVRMCPECFDEEYGQSTNQAKAK